MESQAAVRSKRTRERPPTLTDVVSRMGAAAFALWVVLSAVTSPTAHLRSVWWPAFLLLGALIAVTVLAGGLMTLQAYLRGR